LLFEGKPCLMKPLILLMLLGVCASCSTYQYVTVSSSLSNQNPETFTAENDTAKIAYEFSGENGPVKISIYNKLRIPLYVDWNQSALIVNDTRKNYVDKISSIDAELNSSRSRWMNSTTQTGTIQGTVKSKEISGFIPPQSWAKESQLTLKSDFFQFPGQTTGKEMKRVSGVITRSISYPRDQSPFVFRSYLTLSIQADFSSPIHFDHEFWVSEIMQAQSAPKNFPVQPNRFYIKKTSNTGAYVVVGAVGVAAVVVMSKGIEAKNSLD
jgi:hypothetical protein